MPSEIEISQIKAIAMAPDGHVVVKVNAILGDTPTELEIAMAADLAFTAAIALLTTAATSRAARTGGPAALEVLAAAVVGSGSAEKVRVQLLFDEGAVLPVDMPKSAAEILRKDLLDSLRDAIGPPSAPVRG